MSNIEVGRKGYSLQLGESKTITFIVNSTGLNTARNVTITENIAEGFEILDANNGGTYSNRTIIWELGNMDEGDTRILSYNVLPPNNIGAYDFSTIATFQGSDTKYTIDFYVVQVVPPTPTFNLTLYEGWNLISMPLNTTYSSESFLDLSNCTAISRYGNGIQTHVKGSSMFNFNITAGVGYYTYCLGTKTVTINGSVIEGINIPLAHGWNLIGSIPATITNAGVLKTNISATDCLAVARYTGTGFERWDGTNGTNFPLTSGKGYFAYMKQDGNWVIG